MFSVKTENILLNYFIVLFVVGMLLFISFDYYLLMLFLLLVFSGCLLFYDKYFFFKMSFLISLILMVFLLLVLSELKVVFLIISFIALSQICLLLSYIVLFAFLLIYLEFVEVFVITLAIIFILIASVFLGFRNIRTELNNKLFSFKAEHDVFKHDFSNLCTILFLQNKDINLKPTLDKMKMKLGLREFRNSQCSIAGLLRIAVYLLDYEYNLSVKRNFFVQGENIYWICFFSHILQYHTKRCSTIFVGEGFVTFRLKKEGCKNLKLFLKKQLRANDYEIDGSVLKLVYGK